MTAVQGRCAGCETTDDLRIIDWHVVGCRRWAALFVETGGKVLGPAEEFARWAEQDKAGEHAADLAHRVADTLDQRAAMLARFRTVDILEDGE